MAALSYDIPAEALEVDGSDASAASNSNANDTSLFTPLTQGSPFTPGPALLNFDQTWTQTQNLEDIHSADPLLMSSAAETYSSSSATWNSMDFTSTGHLPELSTDQLNDFLSSPLADPQKGALSLNPNQSQARPGSASMSDDAAAMSLDPSQSSISSKHTLILQNAEPHTMRNILDVLYKDRVKYKLDVDQ